MNKGRVSCFQFEFIVKSKDQVAQTHSYCAYQMESEDESILESNGKEKHDNVGNSLQDYIPNQKLGNYFVLSQLSLFGSSQNEYCIPN